MQGQAKALGIGAAIVIAGTIGLLALLRAPSREGPAAGATAPEAQGVGASGAPAPRGVDPSRGPATTARREIDVAALQAADPRALGVRTQVLRALDDLAAPVAIRRVTCAANACDVVLEAKTREDAGVVIDRLSEPGHGFAGEAESMTLHAVHEDEAGLVVFGFTLAFAP